MQEKDIQKMLDLELHHSLQLRNGLNGLVVFRVIGGWIYEYTHDWDDRLIHAIFVPEPQNTNRR